MDRRDFTKGLAALLAATTLPSAVQAKTRIGDQVGFLNALKEKPWLLGYLGTSEFELRANMHITSGAVPEGLRGHFFRNGPARHNIGKDRFNNWLDAPGMVQRFTFSDRGLSHHGRLIDTARNAPETQADAILYHGFGTHGHGLSTGGSADAQNTANISMMEHAGELLALWEGGSAHVIDPDTLETKGRKSWSEETAGLPFGAHPRVDKDGAVWNLGYSVNPSALILYHIGKSGALKKVQLLPMDITPMIHDFMITETKIVIVAPPYRASNPSAATFLEFFEWKGPENGTVWVIDKSDLSQVTEIEIDPFWVYHFGNAYDISPSEIGFDFALHDDPSFMTKDAAAAMDGSWDGAASAASAYVQARLDLSRQQLRIEPAPEFGQVEFIQTDARENLAAHRYSLMLAQPGGAAEFGFNRLLLVARETGSASFCDLPPTEILEEHLIVPKPDSTEDFWIIGTSLDWQAGQTNLSVYEGMRLAEGPILQAALDLALPLGLHGTFVGL